MLLVGFPVHEFSHALAAYRLGDGTAKLFGRLTLNPVAHFDPLGGILLAVTFIASSGSFGFGWAKPTPVNPSNLRGRPSRRGARRRGRAGLEPRPGRRSSRCRCATSSPTRSCASRSPTSSSRSMLIFVYINLVLMVFNLFPIPPLDGSKVLFAFLPPRTVVAVAAGPRAVRLHPAAARVLLAARRLHRRAHHRSRSSMASSRFLVGI